MYDLAIIGAGWAGFNAALAAKALNLKVCLIDKGPLGGVCLNQGCIPTKTLIQSAKVYSLIKKSSQFGIEVNPPKLDFNKIQERKDKIIAQLSQGMKFMLKGVDFINSAAQLISPDQIKVDSGVIQAKNIIISTGSNPIELAGLKFGRGNIVSSSQLLNVKSIPEKLLVIGAGVIGCEFAGLFAQLGSQVTLVEKTNQILPGMDADIARKLENVFKRSGIEVKTGVEVSEDDTRNYTLALLCVGRVADFSALGLQAAGVKLKGNKIEVDEYLRTNAANIYAAGDCAAKFMLAHYAAYQGRLAVENIFSPRKIKADNPVVPNCIFTQPQICSVGLSQKEAQDLGLKIKIHKFDYLASGAARILDQADGFIKAISDQDSGRILGVSAIGPEACELSAVFTVAISSRLSVRDFRGMIFAHPTLAESFQECLNS